MSHQPYSFAIGRFECIALRDGGHMGSADVLFSNAPGNLLDKVMETEKLDPEQLPSNWTCLLISDGSQRLLVDTGIGSGVGPIGGHLLDQLGEVGLNPADIDYVFLTHGHPDHIGGCADAEGRLTFPQARYLMGAEEYAFWMEESNYGGLSETMVKYAVDNLPAIEGNLELVSPGDEILPGIKVLDASGHTRGHLALEITSGDSRLLNLADTALHPLHLLYPEWYSGLDMQPERAIAARRRLLADAVEDNTQVLFFHFDFPGLGTLLPEAGGWRWWPVI